MLYLLKARRKSLYLWSWCWCSPADLLSSSALNLQIQIHRCVPVFWFIITIHLFSSSFFCVGAASCRLINITIIIIQQKDEDPAEGEGMSLENSLTESVVVANRFISGSWWKLKPLLSMLPSHLSFSPAFNWMVVTDTPIALIFHLSISFAWGKNENV